MKFNLSDFLELNTKELLAVNGGYYCNGSTPSTVSYSNPYYSGGSSSGGGSSSSTVAVVGGNCGAADKPDLSNEKGFYLPIASTGSCSNINLGKYYDQNKEQQTFDAMNDSIKENEDKKYIKGENAYMCDDWVAEVLRDAGYNVEEYFNGDEKDTVQMHIDGLEDGTYTKQVPTEKGVYVVFMNDGITNSEGKYYIPHAGILVVDGAGKMTMWDNSSGNSTGGVESTNVSSLSATKISAFGYDSYYFQKVK